MYFGDANANEIPEIYQRVAIENSVPVELFYSIILNESKSQVSSQYSKKVLPWPWTINHRGKSHFFKNRRDAIHYAKSLIGLGYSSFDVGLGQINWHWHSSRFSSIEQAFDPYVNLTAAAKHFREQYDRAECGNWYLAIGCYHRPAQGFTDKKIAAGYRNRVIKIWNKLKQSS